MRISIEVDTTVDAAYVRLSQNPVEHTVKVSDEVLVDLDEHGVAVGIEVLSEAAELPFGRLVTDFHVHSEVVELLRLIRPSVSAFLEFTQGSDGRSTVQTALQLADVRS
jgi:uncharacterized protein YuzE